MGLLSPQDSEKTLKLNDVKVKFRKFSPAALLENSPFHFMKEIFGKTLPVAQLCSKNSGFQTLPPTH